MNGSGLRHLGIQRSVVVAPPRVGEYVYGLPVAEVRDKRRPRRYHGVVGNHAERRFDPGVLCVLDRPSPAQPERVGSDRELKADRGNE